MTKDSSSKNYYEIRNRVDLTEDIKSIDRLLIEIEEQESLSPLEKGDYYELRNFVTRRLISLSSGSYSEDKELINNYIYPWIIDHNEDFINEAYRLRGVVASWVNEKAEKENQYLRDYLINKLLVDLDDSSINPTPLVWMISRIGFSSKEIVDTLFKTYKTNIDNVGHAALSVLARIGTKFIPKEELISEINSQISSGYSNSLGSAICLINDKGSVKPIFDKWGSESNKNDQVALSSRLLPVMEITNAHYEDVEFQNKTWKRLVEINHKTEEDVFSFGNYGPKTNGSAVSKYFIDRLNDRDESPWGRYLIGGRLESLVMPEHLKGMVGEGEFELLLRDACATDGVESRSSTIESMEKKKAWKTLLRIGYPGIVDIFDRAIPIEPNRFTQASLMEMLSVFSKSSLPEKVKGWITTKIDHKNNSDDFEYTRTAAAVRLAQSWASEESLDTLLKFGFTFEGNVTLNLIYAISSVALNLAKRTDSKTASKLIEIIESKQSTENKKIVACTALRKITDYNIALPEGAGKVLFGFVMENQELVGFRIAPAIDTLAQIEGWTIPDTALSLFVKWAESADSWLSGSSMALLLRKGYLIKDKELLLNSLNIQEKSGEYIINSIEFNADWAPYYIAELNDKYHGKFIDALLPLIEEGGWNDTSKIFPWLEHTYDKQGYQPPEKLISALLNRATKQITAWKGEKKVFELLSKIAPNDLGLFPWEDYWADWIEYSRVGIADVLGELKSVSTETKTSVLRKLLKLTEDGLFAVRRAAYRGIARQAKQEIFSFVATWSDLGHPIVRRKRAAEALEWIDRKEDFTQLLRVLSDDPESSVREIAQNSWESRRKRLWAKDYLEIVFSAIDKDNKKILDTWKYGDALSIVGDDETMSKIRKFLESNYVKSNSWFWLKGIHKQLEKEWGKTTKKWPEPWYPVEGEVVKNKGKLVLNENSSLEAEYSIQVQHASNPIEFSGWGGWLKIKVNSPNESKNLAGKNRILVLSNNKKCTIVITHVTNILFGTEPIIHFKGTGPFPQ